MSDYPMPITPANHVEPVPRRVRATLGGRTVVDTIAARYVWEQPYYPQFYLPRKDILAELVDEGTTKATRRGTAHRHAVTLGAETRPGAALVYGEDAIDGLRDTVHLEWDAVDAWFEEDEQVFVHPRSPYVRVDALRSARQVRVELDGVVLADAPDAVLVFETGLPTRYYLDKTAVDLAQLVASDTQTACPYKGITSEYWSLRTPRGRYDDIAWSYHYPTRQLLPIAGMICFFNERVDTFVDGTPLARPSTHFDHNPNSKPSSEDAT